MSYKVIDLECPGCGYHVTTSTKQCPQCFREIVIDTFKDVTSMPEEDVKKYKDKYRKVLAAHPDHPEINITMAFCYLKLKLYDKALFHFEKAIECNIDNAEAYFYVGVCLLHGKRPFLAKMAVIRKIEEYVSAAIEIEPKGIYYYFLAYIKYDFYEKKGFRTSPSYQEAFTTAQKAGLSKTDIIDLFEILSTERPICL